MNHFITDKISFQEIDSDSKKWNMRVTFEDGKAVKAELPLKVIFSD
jgi:hypothetical protein